MDDDGNEFGIVSKGSRVSRGSRISYGRDGGGKPQRRGTLTHMRDSVRSTRSGVLSRGNSASAIAVPDGVKVDNKKEEFVQLEEITVISKS